MNTLKLKETEFTDSTTHSTSKRFEIYIDGFRLFDRVKQIELKEAINEINNVGAYVANGEILTELTRYNKGDEDYMKSVLMICNCNVVDCWNFEVEILETEKAVIWRNFENNHRNWSYAKLGEFVFDKSEYLNEIKKNN